MKTCLNCFKSIPDDSNFCPYCGYPQRETGFKKCSRGHIIFETWKDCPICASQNLLDRTVFEGKGIFPDEDRTVWEVEQTKFGEDVEETELDLSSVGFFAWLVDITDGKPKNDFRITKERVFLGRDPSSDLMIDDELVSKQHAAIYFRNGEFILDDLNSKNGTFLNGELVERAKLQDGDVIKIGNSEFLFRLLR